MAPYKPKVLTITQMGDPLLRKTLTRLAVGAPLKPQASRLVSDMRHTLTSQKLGIGLAANQVGSSLALAVIAIQPTKVRPNIKPFDLVLINPQILEYIGEPADKWEGCISSGNGTAGLFGKVLRYPRVRVRYQDEAGQEHTQTYAGLKAHVMQHEIDHLNGIIFVDKVTDAKTYMTYQEYIKRIVRSKQNAEKEILKTVKRNGA